MSGAEVFPATRIVTLDLHVGITETNQLHITALLGKHCELLVFSGRALGLIVARERFTAIAHAT